MCSHSTSPVLHPRADRAKSLPLPSQVFDRLDKGYRPSSRSPPQGLAVSAAWKSFSPALADMLAVDDALGTAELLRYRGVALGGKLAETAIARAWEMDFQGTCVALSVEERQPMPQNSLLALSTKSALLRN